MDSARDRATDKIVCGVELWMLQYVDEHGYECPACELTLEPVSYVKDINLKRPYFRKYRKTQHVEGCGMDEAKQIKADARKRSISTTFHGFPLPYPNRLVLDDTYYPAGRPASKGVRGGGAYRWPREGGNRKQHAHTTDTIRPLAESYVNYPYDRGQLSLHVPGVDGSNYEQVFQYLYHDDNIFYPAMRIFYGRLHYKRTEVHETFADVTLSEGLWEVVGGKNVLTSPYVVRIDMTGWTDKLKSCVLDELAVTRKEVMEAHQKGKKNIKGWFFFLGSQDPLNRFLFHVSDYRLICCVADAMARKSLNRAGSYGSTFSGSQSGTTASLMEGQQIATTFNADPSHERAASHRVIAPAVINPVPVSVETAKRIPQVREVSSAELPVSARLARTPHLDASPVPHETSRLPIREMVPPTQTVALTGNKRTAEANQQVSGFRKVSGWLRKLINW